MLGREREWARIERSLAALPGGGVVIALEGTPGIGKTTLWQETVGEARRQGVAVRTTAPAEPDATLAFAGLCDLLDGLPDEVMSGLSHPQARALSSALLTDAGDGAPPDETALLRGSLNVLRALSARAPLLVAIDDEQWLDPPTARVLTFALPRLRDTPIGVIITRRPATDGPLWAALAGDGGGNGLLKQPVEPLDIQAIDALLASRLGHRLPRPLVQRIHAGSGGNPLYALAIAREVQNRRDRGGELPVPRTLADAISGRLRGVDERAKEPLLAVAAASHATLALVHAVVDGFTIGDLDTALAGEVVEIIGDRVRFTHPLLASTHYAGTPAALRRAMHRRLADAIDDAPQRARHLALGAETPAEATAAAIEHGASVAAGRGASEIAADLLEAAARLTPAEAIEARQSRLIRAAERHEKSGDMARSRELLGALVLELPEGRLRAQALVALSDCIEDFDQAEPMLAEALVNAQDDPRLQTRILQERAAIASNRGEFVAMAAYAQAGLTAARQAEDPGLLALSLIETAVADFFIGRAVDWDLVSRAIELEDPSSSASRNSPSGWAALILFWSDDYEPGRPALERALQRARDRGEQYDLGSLLFEFGLLEWYAGNVDDAERLHAASREAMGDQSDLRADMWIAAGEAIFAARRGDLEHAGAAAEEAIALAHAVNDVLIESFPLIVLASIDLWTGSPRRAHDRLHELRHSFVAKGFGFLGSLILDLWAVDVEALIALGRLDEAQEVADDLLTRADIIGNPNAAAIGARSQGLVLAARGDLAASLARADAALAAHEERLLRPELARTLFARGTIQRRAKQKNAARDSLEAALAIFDEIGASMWAARARDELQRVGLRRQAQEGLTPAQARVVELVCAGMSNQQIASTLYMSVRSVESHLTKAYREFGVKSRAQLVATLAAQPTADIPGPEPSRSPSNAAIA